MGLNYGYNGYETPTFVNNYPPMNYGYGGYGGCNGGGLFGNGDSWLGILFLIALLGGGWNNGFGGGNAGRNLGEQMQQGFDQAATSAALAGLQNSVTTGFSNAEVANCGRAIDSIKANYDAQIANMQNNFNNVRDIDNRLDGLSNSLDKCCCENRQAIADVKYTIAQEAAATRLATAQGNQAILDKLCQLELDNVKQQLEDARRANVDLQNRLNMAAFDASQIRQTAEIENYVRPPINPSYTVPNPYACYNNSNCGACGNVIGGCA